MYTCLQVTIWLQRGFGPKVNMKCARLEFCQLTVIRKERFLNDKPL